MKKKLPLENSELTPAKTPARKSPGRPPRYAEQRSITLSVSLPVHYNLKLGHDGAVAIEAPEITWSRGTCRVGSSSVILYGDDAKAALTLFRAGVTSLPSDTGSGWVTLDAVLTGHRVGMPVFNPLGTVV